MRQAWVFAVCVASIIGCAGGGGEGGSRCAPRSWEGECELVSVTKVEDREFPIPYVVMEAVYRPIADPKNPGVTPGAMALRSDARGEFELPLYDYLEAHPRVACRTEPPQNGACATGKISISLPPFDPNAARANAPPPVTGCAQIEATSAQDKLQGAQKTQTVVSQRIAFAANSSELPATADALATEVATLLREKPGIECLGIVGQIASGEPPALAEQRAKAVRELLTAHGVSLTRLLTIGATAKVFGNGARPAEADPADRRVGFSVLLEHAPRP